MAAIGGPFKEVSIGGRTFSVAGDAGGSRSLGGMSNAIESNGDGTARVIQTINGWKLDGLALVIDDDKGDQEFLKDLSNAGRIEVFSCTNSRGTVYQGRGTVTGEIVKDEMKSTASVNFGGGSELTKQ